MNLPFGIIKWPRFKWRAGRAMKKDKGKRKQADAGLGLLRFQERFGAEQACIEHLAKLRWPEGFRCPSCPGARGYQHRRRPAHSSSSSPKAT